MTASASVSLLDALQCHRCGGQAFDEQAEAVRCRGCGLAFPKVHGVVNTLVPPCPEVCRELNGLMREARERGEDVNEIDQFIVRRVPRVTTQREREAAHDGGPRNYYLSTRLNLDQALERIDLSGRRTVLEIGAEHEFSFLRPFRDRGLTCYATNIYFFYDDPEKFQPWPRKVAGDMNDLPFRDGFFDVVLVSATTHHSPNLDRTIREISRVTRPGGLVLILNEPTAGLIKHLWDRFGNNPAFRKGGERNGLIHENEYSVGLYRRLFRKHGLRLKTSVLSRYYEEKLLRREVKGVRWEIVARVVAGVWSVRAARPLLRAVGLTFGQRLLGLEMNVVLEKA